MTVDIFCGSSDCFETVKECLNLSDVAELFHIAEADFKTFELRDLNVIKFSFPRPVVQGSVLDRDQHGAQFAVLLQALEVN